MISHFRFCSNLFDNNVIVSEKKYTLVFGGHYESVFDPDGWAETCKHQLSTPAHRPDSHAYQRIALSRGS